MKTRRDVMHCVSTRIIKMDKYKNKYRIPSARLQTWDYGAHASYFVTINTKNGVHYFGEIHDGFMQLSEIGKTLKTEWLQTFEIRLDMNLLMGEYVVMPNHFHGIVIIGENEFNLDGDGPGDAMHCVSTTTASQNKFGPQSKNLASIIRGFKSAVTINARKIDAQFAWQPRYHDHIIRNNKSFKTISTYIQNNPQNWIKDKFHSL